MLSLRAGNWFLSPMYVLGSQDQEAEYIYICFQRNLYEDLEVKVLGHEKSILFSQNLCPETSNLRIPIKHWPKGEYKLCLLDKERTHMYKIETSVQQAKC